MLASMVFIALMYGTDLPFILMFESPFHDGTNIIYD